MNDKPLYRIQREAMEDGMPIRGIFIALALLMTAIMILLVTPDCAIR